MDKKTSSKIVSILIALAFILLAAGCGGGGGGGNGGAPIDPESVTPEIQVQAMDAVGTALESLPDDATSAERLAAAVEAIAKRPEFVARGSSIEYGIAWGRFPGGMTYVVDGNSRAGYDSLSAASNMAGPVEEFSPVPSWLSSFLPAAEAAPALSPSRTGIPSGPAVLFQALDTKYTNIAAQIIPWLMEAGYSVNVNPETGGSVEDLKRINGPAFFYMGTHGLVAPLFTSPGEPELEIYTAAIMTTTEVTAESLAANAVDIGDQSLVVLEVFPNGVSTRRIAFTPGFVTKYMTFGPDSFVYMDACWSDPATTTRLKDAFFEAGASLYAGWSRTVDDRACAESTPFLLCRMLGATAPKTWREGYQDEGPPRRPFDYGDAYAELRLRGWHIDLYDGTSSFYSDYEYHPTYDYEYNARLAVTENPSGGGGWLRPSIECLRVNEYPEGASSGQSELIVRGSFGTDPGTGPFNAARKVTCGGEELSIVSWSPEEIHATMPVFGNGSAGDVVVTARGIKSNAVPLTEWLVTLVYRVGAPAGSTSTRFTEFSVDCRLRYDIHGWRETATGSVMFALPEAVDPPTHFASNSYGSFRCGGDETFYVPDSNDFMYKIIFGGSGSLPYLASGSGNGCWGSTRLRYEIIGSGQPSTLFIDGSVFAEGYPMTSYILWPDGHISNEEQRRVALNEYSTGTYVVSQGETFRFMIGADGVIEAGGSGNLTWQRALPRYQPTNATPR